MRVTWPVVVVGTGAVGAATLTFALLNPLGTSSASASELAAFDSCAALADHMAGLALDRIASGGYDAYATSGSGGRVTGSPGMGATGTTTGATGRDAGPAPMADLPTTDSAGPAKGAPAVPAAPSMPDSAGNGGLAGNSGTATAGSATAGSATAGSATAGRAPAGDSADEAVGNNASGTNTQEVGVDEADLAKTDGKLLVTVVGGRLVVMDVSGRAPRPRGTVELPGQQPLELLLAGDRALVVGTPTDSEVRRSVRSLRDITTLSIVDLANPDRPAVTSTEEVTARYLSARMTGNTIRVIFSSTPDVLGSYTYGGPGPVREYAPDAAPDYAPAPASDYAPGNAPGYAPGYRGYDRDRQAYLDEERTRLQRVPGEDWLPTRRSVDREARTVSEQPLLNCSDVRYPVTDSGMNLVTVLSVELAGASAHPLDVAPATAVIGSGDLVYASADHLYVATTDGGWNGDLVTRAGGGISTRIHEFDIRGEQARYVATGSVPGYLYGRWAMDESKGMLRLVTTSNPPWSNGATQTGVVVLDTAGGRMHEVGSVNGMGFTENVRSVRWFDDLAAIVTYRQTDPLYLVDVSEPANPRVRGELQMPGYSAYLHPVGDHRLLGIGQDGTQWGGIRGLQMSSFDILDLADPQRTDQVFFGTNSSSPVENDPRGFVYLPDQRLAVLPVNASGFGCPPRVTCILAAPENAGTTGLVAVRVADDGTLSRTAVWMPERARDVLKVMPLPDGRLVALDVRGVRTFDTKLHELGSADYA